MCRVCGIRRYTDEVGRLWQALAGYFIRLGQFEKARDVYDEAIQNVVTVRDFSIVFDAYVLFEESVLNAKINLRQEIDSEAAAGKGACYCQCCSLLAPGPLDSRWLWLLSLAGTGTLP